MQVTSKHSEKVTNTVLQLQTKSNHIRKASEDKLGGEQSSTSHGHGKCVYQLPPPAGNTKKQSGTS